jgi:hypothetical protein
MNLNDILNRYSLLYGDEYPIISEFRTINSIDKSEQFMSLFKIALEIANNPELQKHVDMIRDTLGDKTSFHELVDAITEHRYHIPMGLKNILKRFAHVDFNDALSNGQVRSKKWIADVVKELDIDLGDNIYICAGWYGVLAAILFEQLDIKGNIYSFDINPDAENIADTLNKKYVSDGTRFKAITKDIHELEYQDDYHLANFYTYHDTHAFSMDMEEIVVDEVSCVINTSCEHIDGFDEWWSNVPEGILVILQNNNFDDGTDETVVNNVASEQRWVDKVNLSELMYRGTLKLDKYNRFMVIGRK